MSNLEQMQENIRIFETDAPMDDAAKTVLFEKAKKMTEGVPCTACRYCTTYCPKGIDIPYMLNQYNQITFQSGGIGMVHEHGDRRRRKGQKALGLHRLRQL